MKKWLWILCLLLLCGCEREVEEAPVVETPPVVEAEPVVPETEPERPPVEGLPFYIYDPDLGDEENEIAPGTLFEKLPEDWVCPECSESRDQFIEG